MPRLSNKKWSEIRAKWEGGQSQRSLSQEYDVSEQTIRKHRDAEEWNRDGEVYEPIAESSAQVIVDMITEDPRDQRIAELEAELSRFKPADVKWALNEKEAAIQLADQLEDMIQSELDNMNLERARRGAPFLSIEEMKEKRPKWYDEQVERIIRETVDNLTRWALAEGEATRTLAMLSPDGILKQQPLDEGIGNFGLSPMQFVMNLKAKGHKVSKQTKCLRQDCWLPPKMQYQMRGLTEMLGIQSEVPYLGYCGEPHFILDPLAVEGKLPFGQTTTATTSASFDG